jgi:hypothetical protein
VLPSAISKILAMFGAAVALMAGGRPASSAPEVASASPPASPPTQRTLRESERAVDRMTRERPTGVWKATGHVLVAHGVADRSTGEFLDREWAFGSVCDPDHCRTTFTRTAALGAQAQIEEATLRVHRGYLSAAFRDIFDGCEVRPGWYADFTGHFRMWWTHGHRRLEAIETGRWPGDEECPPAEERIRWVARKSSTSGMRRPAEPSEGPHQVL